MNDAAPVMEIVGLSKSFGPIRAVDGLNFRLFPGEVHGFIGPNGAGKTTTMRIMAGVETPDEGDVVMDGVSVVDQPDVSRRHIGFMPDYLDSDRDILVGEYLDFYSRIYGQPPRRRRRRMKDVLEFTGLADKLAQVVEGLSMGWKQRLSLARVLLNDPKVLILDEPAAGLDPRARIELRDLVLLLASRGKAVFISSHILSELAEMCRSITIIEKGRLRSTGDMASLRRDADRARRVTVELLDPTPAEVGRLARLLAEFPGVVEARDRPGGAAFSHNGDDAFKAGVLSRLVADGFRVTEFHSATTSLEDAFIEMTGGEQGRA